MIRGGSGLFLEIVLLAMVLGSVLAASGAFMAVKNFPKQPSILLAVLPMWCIAGVLVAGALPLGYLVLQKKNREVKAGWNLLPVQVASRDLKGGESLNADALTERSIPEQFVTDSVITAGSRDKALGRRLLGAVREGEPITWTLVGIDVSAKECANAGH